MCGKKGLFTAKNVCRTIQKTNTLVILILSAIFCQALLIVLKIQFPSVTIAISPLKMSGCHPTMIDEPSFFFPDTKAVDFISQEFPPELVSIEHAEVTGFEIYLVEEWVLERKLGTVITTFTGNNCNKIKGYKLRVNCADQQSWPRSLKVYFQEVLETQHAKPKTTSDGTLFVSNLSQIPNCLNLIAIPNGDVAGIWEVFVVNLNLKRMRCGGRSVLMLASPTKSMCDKFKQVYRIPPQVTILYAARELVLLLQVCLYYFDLLNPIFADGLLCDKTKAGISDWWNMIGFRHYGIKPSTSDWMSPTTVAAIIGFILSVRIRFNLVSGSIDVPKDIFDVQGFRVAIGQFQKYTKKASFSVNMLSALGGGSGDYSSHSWKLDFDTIEDLLTLTDSKINTSQHLKKDFHKMKKMLKNTVSDLSSGRALHLNGIGESMLSHSNPSSSVTNDVSVLTELGSLELETMIPHIFGKRLCYLWRGEGRPVDLKKGTLSFQVMRQFQQNFKYKQPPPSSHQEKVEDPTSSVDSFLNLQKTLQTEKSMEPSSVSPSPQQEPSHFDEHIYVLLADNDLNFRVNLQRRCTFPYTANDVNLKLVDHSKPCKPHRATVLKRCATFSAIEEGILTWQYPFSSSVGKMAKEFVKTKMAFRENFVARRSQLEKSRQCKLNVFLAKPNVKLNHKLSHKQIEEMEKRIESRKDILELKLKDIELVNSRLNYELRLLSLKTKEVEESLMQLEQFKIKNLLDRLRAYDNVYKVSLKMRLRKKDKESQKSMWWIFHTLFEWLIDLWFVLLLPRLDSHKLKKLWRKVDPNDKIPQMLSSYGESRETNSEKSSD